MLRKKVLIPAAIIATLLLGFLVGGAWWLNDRYTGALTKIDDVFTALDDQQRPAAAPSEADGTSSTYFLLMGTDGRSNSPNRGERADTIMVVRLSGKGNEADVVSIPRDSWVNVPGHGFNKINAAYAFGGPTLLVETVEQLSEIRIDHFAIVDFMGFQSITEAVGGVTVNVTVPSSTRGFQFQQGRQHMNGQEALAFVQQRYGLPDGDFDRVRRQQEFLRGLMDTTRTAGVWKDPTRIDALARAVASSLTVDSGIGTSEIIGLSRRLANLQASGTTFLTAPVAGLGSEGLQSVVYLDSKNANKMWAHMKAGRLSESAGEFTQPTLG